MKIGLDSYTYHRYFGELRPGETKVEQQWTTWDFLDRVAELKIDGIALQTCFLNLDNPIFRRNLRHRLDDLNIELVVSWGHPYGLEMGQSKDAINDLIQTLSYAQELRSQTIRIVIGHQRYWQQEPEPEIINRLTPIISNIASIANKQGLAIAIENHCEMTIYSFIQLIETLQIPNVGVTLDTANIIRVGADLMNSCKALASKSQLVHMKDLILHGASLGNPGGWWPCAPLGEGDLDLDGVLKTLNSCGYDGLICIEMGDMHPDYNNEDRAAQDSVNYLRQYISREFDNSI